ncbi:MAG: hypothetical protein ABL966_00695 [Acidimicrobiales bacterium]
MCLVGGAAGLTIVAPLHAAADTQGPIDFESYATGSVNGQDGWASTGPFDQAISDNSTLPDAPPAFGTQSFRISDAVTSGSFGDQTFSKATVDAAGELTADTGGFPTGTLRSRFTTSFDFASVTPDVEQAGLRTTVSPDRGDGARMSYVRIADSPPGWNLFFFDFQDVAPLGSDGDLDDGCGAGDNFVETQIASNVTRDPHNLQIVMEFVDGPHNDVVQVLLDGAVIHTGTSWEDYFRYCAESGGGTGGPLADQSRIVRNVLFRQAGAAIPAHAGAGFLIDGFTVSTVNPTLNLTSICAYSGGPYDGQHLWRVTSTYLADKAYTSQSPFNATAVARTATPGRSWFLGVTNTTKINYTNNSGPQQVTKAANGATCSAPAATITTPPDEATYMLDDVVPADFACTGTELVSCVGTVADGAPIDTATTGAKTFTATATAWDGGTAVTTHDYTVIAPPTITSGCKNTQNQSAEMGHYPADPGSQSSLKISCLFESDIDSPAYMVPSGVTIHDFENAGYHNGAARTLTNAAAVSVGDPSIQVGAADGATLTSWVNRAITGPGIAPRTFVTSITSGGQVNLSELTVAAVAIGTGTYKVDNAAGSRSLDSATLTGGATSITTTPGVGTSARFTLADVGLSVSGTRIPAGTTIAGVTDADTATMSNPANGAGTFTAQVLTIGGTMQVTNARQVDDATRDQTLQRVTSLVAKIATSDVGLPIYGTGIAPGAVVTSIVNAALGRMAIGGPCAPLCVTSTSAVPQVVRIGDPTGTATADGDTALTVGAQMDIAASLVPGSQACAEQEPEGFQMVGTYYNPGAFQSPLFGSTAPAGVRVIGQIVFDMATPSDFAGYIVQRGALASGDPVLAEHYDVVFPSLPFTVGMCGAATPPDTGYSSPGLGVSMTILGQTASQARLVSGVGRPGTAQLRALGESTTGYSTTVFLQSTAGPTLAPAANFNRLCAYPATNEVRFTCGNG